MSEEIYGKLHRLEEILRGMKRVMVAFSAGVDSTFLLHVAGRVLGENAVAVTSRSSSFPKKELEEAEALVRQFAVRHIVIETEEMSDPNYTSNPANRCYFCKDELYTKLRDLAKAEGIDSILDGTNFSDIGDFRPGMIAARQLGVRSPLKEAELTKDEIRFLSREAGLSTWDKPAMACLSSRIPYGQEVTPEKLAMIEAAETLLYGLGFRELRVRHHGNIARIEIPRHDFARFLEDDVADAAIKGIKALGFAYVALDLQGYRTGSMNEILVQLKKGSR